MKQYYFRAYSGIAAVAAMVVLLLVIYAIVSAFDSVGWLDKVNKEVIKALIVLLAAGFLLLIQRFISVESVAGVDKNGLSFTGLPHLWSARRKAYLIFWHEIASWKLEEAHLTAHAFSPAVFRLRMTDGRRISIYVATWRVFKPFLEEFATMALRFNLKNPALPPIHTNTILQKRRSAAWLLLIASLSIVTLVVIYALFINSDFLHLEDGEEVLSLAFIGILFAVLIISNGWFLFKNRNNN